jgi:hypothetical protein
MTVAFRAQGTVGTGSTSVTPGLPAGLVNTDIVCIYITTKPDTATITVPTNWSLGTSVAGGGGTTGVDAGPTRGTWIYRVKDSGWSTMPAITVTGGNSTAALAVAYSTTQGSWDVAAASGVYGTAATVTSVSSTMGSNPGITSGDFVLVGVSSMSDAPTWSAHAYTASGISNIGSTTERSDVIETTTGQDVGGVVVQFGNPTGTSTAAPVFTSTASTATRGTVAMLRIREFTATPDPITHVASAHTGYGGAASNSIALTAPSGVAAGDLVLATIVVELADTSPAASITPPSGWTLKASTDTSGTNENDAHVYWKWWTGSETATDRTFALGQSKWRTGFMTALRWAAGSPSPADPWGGDMATGTGTTSTRQFLTYDTSGDGMGIWIHHQWQDSSAPTLPSGYTTLHSSTEHEERLAYRWDTAGTGLNTGSGTGWTGTHGLLAGTLLSAPSTGINVAPTGIATGLAFGTTAVSTVLGVSPTAIASGAAYGSPTVSIMFPATNVSPTAIASAQAMGSPVVATVLGVSPSGVGTSLAFGTPTIGTVLSVSPLGIVTAEAVGSPAVSVYLVTTPQSIATAAVLGQPTVTTVVTVQPPGIASSVGLGSPTLSSALAVGPVAVPTGEVFGSPAAQSILQTAPVGIATSLAFGAPVVSPVLAVVPDGIDDIKHAPLSITTGGTYTGSAVNLTYGEVAIEILTTQPVVLEDMDIYSVGAGIEAPITGTQLTVRNCRFTSLKPDMTIREQQAIRAWEPHTLVFENNTLENAHGVQVSGAGYVSTTIRIDKNYMHNIGRLSQPNNYQGAVHLDNVQCPGGKVRWNHVFNERGKSHSEDTIACSNGTSGALGNEWEIAYNFVNGTYPIDGDDSSFTGGAYDFGDISGGYIIAHHNYAINYTNNGFMIPSGHDILIHDCVAVYDGLADDGVRCSTYYGWGFTVNNLYGGGVSPNTYLQDNRSAHRRWNGSSWETANYQWNPANAGDQDLGGNTILGVGSQALEDAAESEWEALVAANGVSIGATGAVGNPNMGYPTVTTVVGLSPVGIGPLLAVGNPSILGMNTAAPTGIASGLVFGVPIATVTTNAQPGGISIAMVMGDPVVSSVLNVVAQAIASALAMGVPSISVGLTVAPVGIATAQVLGVPVLGTVLLVQPTGVESAVVLGEPITSVNIDASPIGVESLLEFGLPSLASVLGVEILGISSAEVFGQPTVIITAESQGRPGARKPVTVLLNTGSYTRMNGGAGAFIKPNTSTARRNNGNDGAWITEA